jgi:hypothetical protein
MFSTERTKRHRARTVSTFGESLYINIDVILIVDEVTSLRNGGSGRHVSTHLVSKDH